MLASLIALLILGSVVAAVAGAMRTIDAIRERGKPEDMIRLLASREILDRAFGKPKTAPVTSVGLVGTYDMSKLNNDQVRTVADILRLAAPSDVVGEAD